MGPDAGSSPASRSRPGGWQRLEGEAGPARGTQPKRCWDRPCLHAMEQLQQAGSVHQPTRKKAAQLCTRRSSSTHSKARAEVGRQQTAGTAQ